MRISANDNWSVLYSGAIDLGTYEYESGDNGCQISCNVGDIGIKTIFNNRYDTEVQLIDKKTLDGDVIFSLGFIRIEFPQKEFTETTSLLNESGIDEDVNKVGTRPGTGNSHSFLIPFGTKSNNEFSEGVLLAETLSWTNQQRNVAIFRRSYTGISIDINYSYQFKVGDVQHATHRVVISQNARIRRADGSFDTDYIGQLVYDNDSNIGWTNSNIQIRWENKDFQKDDSIEVFVTCGLQTNLNSDTVEFGFRTPPNQNNHFTISGIGVYEATNHGIVLASDALQQIIKIIGGRSDRSNPNSLLQLKSDWYDRVIDRNGITWGGGALKGLLNGYELRHAEIKNGERPPIRMSFKWLYDSLNAIDNIGWGFSEENGTLFLRVERWQWFYQDDVILRINNPANKKRRFNTERAYVDLSVGYEKFLEDEELKSMDGFHRTIEISRKLQGIDKKLERVSKFVADPFAIEFTRRKSYGDRTQTYTFDNNIFVVCLKYISRQRDHFFIDIGITEADNISNPSSLYNGRISPNRNAIRHSESMFSVNSPKNNIQFISGNGNMFAKFSNPEAPANTFFYRTAQIMSKQANPTRFHIYVLC